MAKTDSSYQDIYGRRPDELKRKKVSAKEQQQAAIDDNLEILGKAGELSRKTGEMDTDALIALMERALPNYKDTSGKALSLARDMMAGEVPQSMKDQMAQRAAERGISTGTSGSQFANFGELQSYGINQMEYMQKGFTMFGQVADRTRALVGNPMSVASMFMTPEQRLGHATAESDKDAQVSSYNRNLQAMPDAGLLARENSERMMAASRIGQPVGPQLVGSLNPSGGARNPFSGGLAGYQGRAAQRRNSSSGYRSANYNTA